MEWSKGSASFQRRTLRFSSHPPALSCSTPSIVLLKEKNLFGSPQVIPPLLSGGVSCLPLLAKVPFSSQCKRIRHSQEAERNMGDWKSEAVAFKRGFSPYPTIKESGFLGLPAKYSEYASELPRHFVGIRSDWKLPCFRSGIFGEFSSNALALFFPSF
jgi:hypothetical protein